MKKLLLLSLVSAVGLLAGACSSFSTTVAGSDELVGAWRGKIQFTTGSFASVKDLELMYLFNAGGTMTESSNYDGAPPVPPAYGVWRKIGPRHYEAHYEYYWTKSPAAFDEIAKGGGWLPGGVGVLTQKITLAPDARTFDSTLTYAAYDQQGKLGEPVSVATAQATRMGF